ncbi:MAG: hypothetical protein Q8P21_01300 [bacterium]|nr:hypothetical protein [bacterium]
MDPFDEETLQPGDQMQQIAPFGLSPLAVNPYLVKVVNGDLELSREPGGPPIPTFSGEPMHFPRLKFRKVA